MKRNVSLLSLFALSLFALIAQTRVPAKITDSGELYSTYDLAGSTSDQAEIKRQIGSIPITEVVKYSHEDYWPLGISSLSQRDRNRASIPNYKVYRIATFASDKAVLVIPADENGHMPTSMRPERNIYFIIGTSGIQVTGGSSYSANSGSGSSVSGKVKVKITDSGELYSTYGLSGEAADKAEISKQVGASLLSEIVTYSEEGNWPSGISTLDGRNANRPQINNYTAYRVATFGSNMAVLQIPASENKHMSSAMRPSRDIYFIMSTTGFEVTGGVVSGSGSGPKAAKITDSGELYSTYGLSGEADDKAEIGRQVSSSQLNDIVTYSEEDNWPSGISTLTSRDENRPKINTYKVYQVATFGSDKAVLMVPASENKHMPSNMRPSRDIYFIMGTSGFELTGGSSYNGYSAPSSSSGNVTVTRTKVKITDSGELYSTYDFDNDRSSLEEQVGSLADNIITYGTETNWPSGIATLDARDLVRPQILKYTAYKIATVGSDQAVLVIPASENKHMPTNMQPRQDIYFVMSTSGFEVTGGGSNYTASVAQPPATTPANNAAAIPQRDPMHIGNLTLYPAKITDPWQLMSTHDLGAEASFKSKLVALTSDEIDYVVQHSKESFWPSGISTFEKRELTRERMVDYNVYTLCKFTSSSGSEMVVLYVPASENAHMRADMRPEVDIFITLLKAGVATR